jgi:hypothetical protein
VLAVRPLVRGLPRAVDALFAGKPRAELAVVMVCLPLAMNTAQAWLQDALLKARSVPPAADGAPASELELHAAAPASAPKSGTAEQEGGEGAALLGARSYDG